MTQSSNWFARAFSATDLAAYWFMSIATTFAAPARAQARARMPVPVQMSATHLPLKSRREMNAAKNSLVRKYRGWKTVGRTTKWKPAARVTLVRCRFRIRWYEKKWMVLRKSRLKSRLK
jgi:hypothetical protein